MAKRNHRSVVGEYGSLKTFPEQSTEYFQKHDQGIRRVRHIPQSHLSRHNGSQKPLFAVVLFTLQSLPLDIFHSYVYLVYISSLSVFFIFITQD